LTHLDPAFLQTLLAHHRALLVGRPGAANTLAALVDLPINRYLRSHMPATDAMTLTEAADDALLDYVEHPERARAETGREVWSHLMHSAWCNVIDIVRKESRRGRAEAQFAVEDSRRQADYTQQVAELQLCGVRLAEESSADDLPLPPQLLDLFDEHDLAVLRLMRSGERQTVAYAGVLGIRHRAPREQAALTRRVKERLRQRLKRMGFGHLLRATGKCCTSPARREDDIEGLSTVGS
jgi:hypothetical protein